MEDEYRLAEVLGYGHMDLLEPLTAHLDKVLGVYLDNEKDHAKTHARRAYCYLSMALNASENGRCDLRERITEIIDGYQKMMDS